MAALARKLFVERPELQGVILGFRIAQHCERRFPVAGTDRGSNSVIGLIRLVADVEDLAIVLCHVQFPRRRNDRMLCEVLQAELFSGLICDHRHVRRSCQPVNDLLLIKSGDCEEKVQTILSHWEAPPSSHLINDFLALSVPDLDLPIVLSDQNPRPLRIDPQTLSVGFPNLHIADQVPEFICGQILE